MNQALRIPHLTALVALLALGCGEPAPDPDGGCTPGTAGCACLEGDMCADSLVCEADLCRSVETSDLQIVDPAARSCEVVLVEEGTEVLGVRFSEGVLGTSVREAPRTAVTFLREDDSAFPSGAVTVLTTEREGRVMLGRARCFDRDGVAVSGNPLRIGG